jgi:hypothetical protein
MYSYVFVTCNQHCTSVDDVGPLIACLYALLRCAHTLFDRLSARTAAE